MLCRVTKRIPLHKSKSAHLLVLILLATTLTIAHVNDGLLEKRITLHLQNVPLKIILQQIEGIANIKFLYSEDQINVNANISLQVTDEPLGSVLHTLLFPHQISFKVHDRQALITLRRKLKASWVGDPNQSISTRQPLVITGTVTDQTSGSPLVGVNVIVRGTTNGTATDGLGKYSLQAEPNDIIVFSFIGYKSSEVNVNNRSVIDMTLTEEASSLKAVSYT
ncbi:MAG: carboxypeptidase-like regulatory domain-containing protein, partial [Cyclobacteriaceae bacterium]